MPVITPEILNRLQKNPKCIRNICILAHVDHGKTTLSDSLVATNGIISSRMAGKVRYLDSREDEQLRGITMESSAISLYFKLLTRDLKDESKSTLNEYLINLVDSPGHIDFSSEVSIASRLCDGALVLIDVVEGIQSQTITVLRQAWNDKLKPILVLNKIDRLFTELRLTPSEVYTHLKKIIEQANVIIGNLYMDDRILQDEQFRQRNEQNEVENDFVEKDDSDLYFQPEKNNVIFGSAIDNWGFTIKQFLKFYEKKLGFKSENLQKCLWGDYYLDPKTKKIINHKGLKGRKSLKPLFVSLILDNIHKIYEETILQQGEKNLEVLQKIISTLNLRILPRDLRSKDSKYLLRLMMSQWLPISSSILIAVVDFLDSPVVAQAIKFPEILKYIDSNIAVNEQPSNSLADDDKEFNLLEKNIIDCDSKGQICCYVSKMISVPENELPTSKRSVFSEDLKNDEDFIEKGRIAREKARKAADQALLVEDSQKKKVDATISTVVPSEYLDYELDPDLDAGFEDFSILGFSPADDVHQSKEVMIGLSRVYSGTLKIGSKLKIISPKYESNSKDDLANYVTDFEVRSLYLIMGRELIAINEVPAGNLVGIGGLDNKVYKNCTLISDECIPENFINFAKISSSMLQPPIVKVAIEPVNPLYLEYLDKGLKILEESDPIVKTYVNDNGEHILCCSGELHLERCLKDLKERFAGVDLQVSEPSIPYRETIVGADFIYDDNNAGNGMEYEGFGSKDINPPKNAELGRGVDFITLYDDKHSYVEHSENEESKVEDPIPEDEDYLKIKISVKPMPDAIVNYLIDHEKKKDKNELIKVVSDELSREEVKRKVMKYKEMFYNCNNNSDEDSSNIERIKINITKLIANNLVTFGPKRVGPNLLFDKTGELATNAFNNDKLKKKFILEDSILNGFQLVTNEGPLCAEIMQGVAIIVESVEIKAIKNNNGVPSISNLSNKFLRKFKDCVYENFLDWSPRLMLAIYKVEIQATSKSLGKIYTIINKRHGQILSEDIKDGSTLLFEIKGLLPIVESFGFNEEFFKITSGDASIPQLIFQNYQILNEDPYWKPKTNEELELLGAVAERENLALKYVNSIRKSKGLFVDEVTVKNAEKQRNLKKD